MAKRLLFLTGSPGVGKTSVLLRVVDALKAKGGYPVGGMISREARSGGERVGFEILDVSSEKRGWLAHVDQGSGPRVGRYGVNLKDIDEIGANAISKAAEAMDVVVVDEIGRMELFSSKFREAVKGAIESGKLVVGVVHWKARDRLIDEIKSREDAEVYVVTDTNRDRLHEAIIEESVNFLETR